MKKGLLLLCVAFCFGLMSFTSTTSVQKEPAQTPSIEQLIPEAFKGMSADELLNLSPRQYKELTGERLSIKEAIALKAAQKQLKKHMAEGAGGDKPDKSVYIILAIFISFVGVGLATDWKGNDWIINLVLSLLCWIPGVIHALIKMKDYYGS